MDPIHLQIETLARAGITVTRVEEPFLELYRAPGYPELTRGQVFDLARQNSGPPGATDFASSSSSLSFLKDDGWECGTFEWPDSETP